MKTYNKPLSDVVLLHTSSDTMQNDYTGYPQGSYQINEWNEENPETLGGDDVNSFNVSLWDEE